MTKPRILRLTKAAISKMQPDYEIEEYTVSLPTIPEDHQIVNSSDEQSGRVGRMVSVSYNHPRSTSIIKFNQDNTVGADALMQRELDKLVHMMSEHADRKVPA